MQHSCFGRNKLPEKGGIKVKSVSNYNNYSERRTKEKISVV